jgi:hypothetical protein
MSIIKDMQNCEQTIGQSVYDHGRSVYEHYLDLEALWFTKHDVYHPKHEIRLPPWYSKYQDEIFDYCYDYEMWPYLMFHDCGKPYCRVVDESGKVHFPNHAEVSAKKFLEEVELGYFGIDAKDMGFEPEDVAALMRDDMVLHTASAEEISQRLKVWTKAHAYSLIIAALCEVNSNAKMFGGFESTSFKIKFKQVCKRSKQILEYYNGQESKDR